MHCSSVLLDTGQTDNETVPVFKQTLEKLPDKGLSESLVASYSWSTDRLNIRVGGESRPSTESSSLSAVVGDASKSIAGTLIPMHIPNSKDLHCRVVKHRANRYPYRYPPIDIKPETERGNGEK